MKKQEKSKNLGQKADSMNALDQGLNLFPQIVNNAIGIDKGNDDKINKND
ncbi:hypothetical protein [Peribacillus simplex]|nr:hypothetical protein [Peribacillus simplex]WHY96891.1 hypothetical protein QNH37_23445 [Peribacillus simplex]